VTTYKVLHCALVCPKHDGRVVVGHLALGLRVDSDQVQLLPHGLHQLVNVPAVLRADGHSVGDPVEQVELLDADGVDLVEHIDDGDVAAALGLEHVDQIVDGGVATDGDVGRADLVLGHDGPDLVVVDMGQRYRARDVEAALVLLLEGDVGRALVDADAEPFQLSLDDALVRQGLVDVEHDEDQMARLGHGDDLTTTTAAVLGTLDDTGQIDDLEGCAVVDDLTGHTREGCELVGGRLGVLTRQPAHEGTLADRGKADEANRSHTRPGNIETSTTTSATARRGEKLTLELGELRL